MVGGEFLSSSKSLKEAFGVFQLLQADTYRPAFRIRYQSNGASPMEISEPRTRQEQPLVS